MVKVTVTALLLPVTNCQGQRIGRRNDAVVGGGPIGNGHGAVLGFAGIVQVGEVQGQRAVVDCGRGVRQRQLTSGAAAQTAARE